MRYPLLAILAAALVTTATAETATPKLWKGDVEFGYVQKDGNTNETTLKGHSDIERKREQWQYNIEADAANTETDGVRSAEAYFLSNRLSYDFSPNNYTFGYISYDDDRFSGFKYQATVAFGYGRRLINRDNMKWDIEAGPGYRRSEVDPGVTGESDSEEAILRLYSKYSWDFSDSATFAQKISAEAGDANTISRSETSLKTKVIGGLALKLSYIVDYKREVPDGSRHADKETALTLVYSF